MFRDNETSANPPEADCAFSFPLPWWEGGGGVNSATTIVIQMGRTHH
ncbi:MAG: hypothetical protein QMD05_03500 [Candidatus Brocadiaceae bacterium]|nr:hypothetical protein [Candidatus Brocadiaceae bacterium]